MPEASSAELGDGLLALQPRPGEHDSGKSQHTLQGNELAGGGVVSTLDHQASRPSVTRALRREASLRCSSSLEISPVAYYILSSSCSDHHHVDGN